MDFAKSQLLKYGWEDGKGLGKNESGMKDHLKVKLKMDKTGIGHDIGKEYTNHWWDNVFNKTASSIQVTDTQDGVEIKRSSKHEKEISKNLQTYSKKAMAYGSFVRKATLSDGHEREVEGLKDDSIEDNGSGTTPVYCLVPENEEEIFSKCGGRTAHKGARHGLKLNGKLQRIQEQEQLLLDRLNSKGTNQIKTDRMGLDRQKGGDLEQCKDDIKRTKSKKKKKKTRGAEAEVVHEDMKDIHGIGNKRKLNEAVSCDIDVEPICESERKVKKKKTKKHESSSVTDLKNKDNLTDIRQGTDFYKIDDLETLETVKTKKKKKKKNQLKEL